MVILKYNPIPQFKLILVLAVIGVIIITLNSCSVTRNKKSNQSRMDSSMSITSEVYRKIEKDSTIESTTKTTEQIDTTLTLKSDTLSGAKSISDILRGDTLKAAENGLIIKVFKDATGLLKAIAIVKEKKVSIQKTKTTETKTKIVDKGKSVANENVKTKVQVKKKEKNLTVETKTSYWSWWYLLLLLIPLGYYLYRKLKSTFAIV